MSTLAGLPTFSEVLRDRLREATSLRRVSIATGIDRTRLRMFKLGRCGLNLETADSLAQALGVTAVAAPSGTPGGTD